MYVCMYVLYSDMTSGVHKEQGLGEGRCARFHSVRGLVRGGWMDVSSRGRGGLITSLIFMKFCTSKINGK